MKSLIFYKSNNVSYDRAKGYAASYVALDDHFSSALDKGCISRIYYVPYPQEQRIIECKSGTKVQKQSLLYSSPTSSMCCFATRWGIKGAHYEK